MKKTMLERRRRWRGAMGFTAAPNAVNEEEHAGTPLVVWLMEGALSRPLMLM